MKKAIILLTITFPTLCFSQWNEVYNHADQETSMAVLNKDTLIAVTNTEGRIHRSTDGGQSWSFYQTIFTESGFYDVHFPTQEVGYACGGADFGLQTNIIVKTLNSGLTWDSIISTGFTGSSFSNIHFINVDTGFVSPDANGLLITTDGGANFSWVNISTGISSVTEIVSTPNQTVFVSTREYLIPTQEYVFSILKTTDLGNNWTIVHADTMSGTGEINLRQINKMFFIDNNVGYCAGGAGLFMKTTDGGNTWATSFIHPYTNLSGLHFTSENVGYTNNAGGIYKTTDGGMNWSVQNLSQPSIISQIQFANDTIGFAIGQEAIYKTTNAGDILNLPTINDENKLIIYPNPANNAISILGAFENIESIKIFNSLGQIVQEMRSQFDTIDISTLPNGIYSLSIETDMNRQIQRLVKE
jgi:photosystem II stability/assembly factor-like uncharacterized protein